jgi:hypothetical protein
MDQARASDPSPELLLKQNDHGKHGRHGKSCEILNAMLQLHQIAL